MENDTKYPHNKARLEQFSDGVFAIAITLLALEIHVPSLYSNDFAKSFVEISKLLPNIITFVISFVAIAIFWVNHHQLTQTMGLIKRRILWSNILFLLFITLIPFATNVVSVNPNNHLAILTYSLIMFGGSISFSIARYFVHKSLGEEHVSMSRSYIGPFIYLLAVVLSPVSIIGTYVLLAIPLFFYFLPKSSRAFPKAS